MRGHRQRESCQACESGEVESNQTGCYATHNDSANPPAPFINHIISLHYASYCVSYQTSFPPQLTPAGEPDPYLALGLWRRPADRGPARVQKKKKKKNNNNNKKKKKKIASIYRNKDKAKNNQQPINPSYQNLFIKSTIKHYDNGIVPFSSSHVPLGGLPVSHRRILSQLHQFDRVRTSQTTNNNINLFGGAGRRAQIISFTLFNLNLSGRSRSCLLPRALMLLPSRRRLSCGRRSPLLLACGPGRGPQRGGVGQPPAAARG